MSIECCISRSLTAHEGYWGELAHVLRAMETDEEAARAVRRQVRNAMACALLAGFEGREPGPRKPRRDATNLAQEWVGTQLLRDIGPRDLSRSDWLEIAQALTRLAGPRIRTGPAEG